MAVVAKALACVCLMAAGAACVLAVYLYGAVDWDGLTDTSAGESALIITAILGGALLMATVGAGVYLIGENEQRRQRRRPRDPSVR